MQVSLHRLTGALTHSWMRGVINLAGNYSQQPVQFWFIVQAIFYV
jgi:hypothetical protein